ncbi:MAG: phosphohydrolase, partial [Anaerolineae bacterium]|nr:phosphohydrolase [Anaerolineae bacterium]
MHVLTRYNEVVGYTHKILTQQLDPRLTYHCLSHTFDDVLPAVKRIGALEEVDSLSLELVMTAAVLHDIGFIHRRDGHEDAGIRISQEILPKRGYEPAEVEAIVGMIHATKIPQSPNT